MDIVFRPPVYVLIVFAAVFVVVLLAALLKKMDIWKKILTIVLGAAVCGALIFFFYRPRHFIVDAQGIQADTYGKVSIPWGCIEKAIVVNDLASSPYALRLRTNGVAIGSFRSGWFQTAGGQSAFVTTETAGPTLVIEAEGKLYIFACWRFRTMWRCSVESRRNG
jgi:hypothetical protein